MYSAIQFSPREKAETQQLVRKLAAVAAVIHPTERLLAAGKPLQTGFK